MIEAIPDWIVPVHKLVLSDQTGEWCKLPYPNHKKGCPNYGKKSKCPPTARPITHFMRSDNPIWLVHSEFDLKAHMVRMKEKHSHWTERQCRCVLYWQNTSRKQLKERMTEAFYLYQKKLRKFKPRETATMTAIPEGHGVNVYVTAKLAGLTLEKIKDLKTCRHIGLIGTHLKWADRKGVLNNENYPRF